MRIALLTTDNREDRKDYGNPVPHFGSAPEALLQGFALIPSLEVHVVSCTQVPMTSPARLAPNIHFHSLHVPRLGWLRTGYQGCIRAVRRKLREIQPDLVHGQGTERDCALSAVFSGRPNVLTIHGNMAALTRQFGAGLGSYGRLASMLETLALKRTGGVFCNSAYTEKEVSPRARRTWRVPNAVREIFFEPAPAAGQQKRCGIVNVGVISPRKRQLELLQIAEQLHREGLEFEFRFAGETHLDPQYTALCQEKLRPLEQAGCARFVGLKSGAELVRLCDESAGMVHFSPAESFGLAVAEGLARDLKVFAAGVGGVPEVAAGAPGAELFEVNDWPGLTAALGKWIRGGFPRARGAGEVMKARYHPRLVADRHVQIYAEVLKRS